MRRESTRELLTDLALWAVLALCVLLRSGPDAGGSWWWVATGVPLLGAAVLLCRTAPLVSLGIAVSLSAWQTPELFTASYAPAMAAFGYLSGRRTPTARPALLAFAAVAAAGLVLSLLLSDLWSWIALLVTLLLVVVVPWLSGRYVRQYAQLVSTGWRLAEHMEREREAAADRERLRERSRIAADMHDGLGHDLSLIAVRAAALEVDADLGERQRRAARELREAAAEATARLRDVVGVLREDGAPAPAAPGGETVAALVERARDAGLDVALDEAAPAAPPPGMTALAVHRVVQEALTNAARHAPGARVRVAVAYGEDAVTVTVASGPGRAAATASPPASGGTGLVGLGERVRLAGGNLAHGPDGTGGFTVTARLPLSPDAPPPPPAPTTAGRLHDARRRVRRDLLTAVAVPLAASAAIALLVLGFRFWSDSRTVMDPARYDALRVGDTRAEVLPLLPRLSLDGAPAGVQPEPAGAGDCAYYRAERYEATPAYRLCFRDGRLASKAVVTDVDNEEDRPR
ncbi:sensor histidine kinase [Streptomyces genisteinicus]|uniref:histidine kinase n=1 Tax=Streptomyces genisteinicus TaxID=2768068 RepID=A0A7H0HXW8_9ACTN|nr:histidine kinase [Streptomyces genisteinicus]QNP65384.1 sensor histidine kinase [Streptomyces genisteinicus]